MVVSKRTIVAGLFIIFIMLAAAVAVSTDIGMPDSTQNAKEPPAVQEQGAEEQTTIRTLESGTDDIVCQQPPKGNEYGGISGTESKPPIGTIVDPNLTGVYGRSTATGVCGTYWFIVGWWFNASEMVKLPAETITYGVSPYAITEGSDSVKGEGDKSISPVPEIATVVLVAIGICTFVIWKRNKR